MTLISSKKTIFYKKVFPVLLFGGLLLVIGDVAFDGAFKEDPLIVLGSVLLAVVVGFLAHRMLWALADEVIDNGDHLLILRRGQQDQVMFSNIMNVSTSTVIAKIPCVSIRLIQPSKFGSEISFLPFTKFTFNPFFKSEIADELIVRSHAAKAKSGAYKPVSN